MEVIGVIPARYGSTRFEGKVLADILGKPMIHHVYERAKKARVLDDLIIATDNEKIIKAVKKFKGKAVFTSPDQPTGTDRLTEVVNPIDVKVVVNIQGDEPLVSPETIDHLASAVLDVKGVQMATVITKITDKKDLDDPNAVKVITDRNGFAIYFSRSRIPYNISEEKCVYYKHIGLYAYTKDFLFTYKNLPKSRLEQVERLEQLRVLEHGYKIKTVETNHDTIGVDVPEDLEKVKQFLLKEKA
jgi:3-deoxy-manno-octulosonate cytidylyltransferase (CMP-KDO synthetase)